MTSHKLTYMYRYIHVCKFVCCYLATTILQAIIAINRKGVADCEVARPIVRGVNSKQIGYITLIGVHSPL